MQKVSLKDIQTMAKEAKSDLESTAKDFGREVKVYLHWTAGRYDTTFTDYHINITGDGTIYASTPDLGDTLCHTWKRNSGSIGVTLCCAYNATSNNLGAYAPTETQIDVMAQVCCVLADALDIPIDKQHILTHGEAADNEDARWVHPMYGPNSTCERWDLEFLGTKESPRFNPKATDGSRGGDVLRGKAIWYKENGLLNQI